MTSLHFPEVDIRRHNCSIMFQSYFSGLEHGTTNQMLFVAKCFAQVSPHPLYLPPPPFRGGGLFSPIFGLKLDEKIQIFSVDGPLEKLKFLLILL